MIHVTSDKGKPLLSFFTVKLMRELELGSRQGRERKVASFMASAPLPVRHQWFHLSPNNSLIKHHLLFSCTEV
jgi:hypothetical protein